MADKKFVWVRSIYGSGADPKKQYSHISDGGMNDIIKSWHSKQPKHDKTIASPSQLLVCPRVVWFYLNGVEPTNTMTWAVEQRLMLGRQLENMFAMQAKDEGILLKHWQDDEENATDKLHMGEGLDHIQGVPDYILQLGDKVAVSDAKTSRSDSFGYVPLDAPEIWNEWNWYKYKIQLTAYYMLCQANKSWFADNNIPLPEICHLFSYALDDGVVRREVVWTPTQEDMDTVIRSARRYNSAVKAEQPPECTCQASFDGFDVKFCDFGIKEKGAKIAESCCSLDLLN